MAAKEELRSQVISNMRACLLSTPGSIPAARLNSEYRELLGENIPFRDLGFKSLEDFLQTVADVSLFKKDGVWYLEARKTGASEHVAKLVERQKKTKSKSKRMVPQRSRRVPHNLQPQLRYKNFQTARRDSPFRPSNNISPRPLMSQGPPPMRLQAQSSPRPQPQSRPSPQPQAQPPPQPLRQIPQPQSQSPHVRMNHSFRQLSEDKGMLSVRIPTGTHASPPPTNQPKSAPVNSLFRGPVFPPVRPDRVIFPPGPNFNEPVHTFIPSQLPPTAPPPMPDLPQLTKTPAQRRLEKLKQEAAAKPKPEPVTAPALAPVRDETNTDSSESQTADSEDQSSNTSSQTKIEAKRLQSIKQPPIPIAPDSFVAKLLDLCKNNHWPDPEFILLPRVRRYKSPLFTARVNLQCFTSVDSTEGETFDFSTFPSEFSNHLEAQECAAKKAYEELTKKVEMNALTCSVTNDDDVLFTRIESLVKGKPQGIWAFSIESEYRTKYSEKLPSDWLRRLKNSNTVKAEEIAGASFIIKPKDGSSSTTTKTEHAPPKLILPSENYWDVYVTKADNPNSICLRIVGDEYSGKYEEMATEMELHYMNRLDKLRAPSAQPGRYYAHQSDDCVLRVKVESLTDDGKVVVKYIDHGDSDEVSPKDLCVLDIKFMELPAQAISCSIWGLASCTDGGPVIRQILTDEVEGQVLVAEVVDRSPQVIVNLYDTSGDEPVNLTSSILAQVDLELVKPSLPQVGALHECMVTHVEPFTDIYIQLLSSSLDYLNEQIACIVESLTDSARIKSVNDSDKDKVFIVKKNSKWYRAKLVTPVVPLGSSVTMSFLDRGGTDSVQLDSIYDPMSSFIQRIPEQAIRVSLEDVPKHTLNSSRTDKMKELIKSSSKALLKVISRNENPPLVHLFVRMSSNNALVSVSTTIIHQVPDSDVKAPSKSQISPTGAKPTRKLKLNLTDFPKGNEYFYVYVLSVVNPSNFIIVPVNLLPKFNTLCVEMLDMYSSSSTEVLSNPEPGDLCAVPHNGSWYRGYVDKIIDPSQVTVRLFDVGNMVAVLAEDLRVLDLKFVSSNYPRMAYNANLSDIIPLNADWTVDDCLLLQSLIANKKLVSVINGVESVPGPQQVVLRLTLVDTTGDTDVNIGRFLVVEGRAKYT